MFSAFSGKGPLPLPSANVLSIPLILGYCQLIGVRFVFDVPAHLRANWIFRFLLDNHAHESVALARRVMLCLVSPWMVFVALPVYVHFWGWKIGFLHMGLVTIWLVLLSEVLLVGFRKLPFTCTYPSFQPSAVVALIAYVLGYFAFAVITSELESEALSSPVAGGVFLVMSLGVWYTVHRTRRSAMEIDEHLVFEDSPAADFELLHLTDGG